VKNLYRYIIIFVSVWLYLTSPALSLDIPLEPEPGVASKQFIDWYILSNGMIQFNFDLDLDGKVDYYTLRRLKPSGQGMAHTQAEAEIEASGFPHSLFIYYFDGGVNSWRWFALEKYPLFYSYHGILYKDMEEDNINGNETIYENSLKTEKKI
jgi:hypothetical protein